MLQGCLVCFSAKSAKDVMTAGGGTDVIYTVLFQPQVHRVSHIMLLMYVNQLSIPSGMYHDGMFEFSSYNFLLKLQQAEAKDIWDFEGLYFSMFTISCHVLFEFLMPLFISSQLILLAPQIIDVYCTFLTIPIPFLSVIILFNILP